MNRYYFYKRNENIREDLKGDVIDFSLCALYSSRAYSQKLRKEISDFHYFDEIKLCISTKNPGIYLVAVDTGTDGCHGHYAKSLKELKEALSGDEYSLISEREYFRRRKLAMRLIFKHINFFNPDVAETERKYLLQRDFSRDFYDIKLISTSEKYNIRNYDQKQIEFGEKISLPMNDLRIDEDFRVFLSKYKSYKCNSFQIESSHFNPYYKNYEKFLSGSFLRKDKKTVEIKDFQFERLKRMVIEFLLERADLDISKIIPKQQYTTTILDI